MTDITTREGKGSALTWAEVDSNFTNLNNDKQDAATAFSGAYADLTGKPTLFSGAYSDLTGKPTLGTAAAAAASDFATATQGATADSALQENDVRTITNKTISGSSNTLTNIGNASLVNSTFSINNVGVSLGGAISVDYPVNQTSSNGVFLQAGTKGVNISNGGTVTAITRTATGSGYTVAPTVTISAPTTAGGVQATATCTVTAGVVDTTFTITNAGSGYVEQPTVSFSGGGGSGAAAYAKVGGDVLIKPSLNGVTNFVGIGGATALQIYDAGGSSGASGSTWKIGSNFSSSGAVLFSTHEANFSSGGTNAVRFYTNTVAQEQFRVAHTASAVNYVQVTGAATGGRPVISMQGSDSNINCTLQSKGSFGFTFQNSLGSNSFSVTHVNNSTQNYLQATASLSGSSPFLSSQGSDTNIDLALTPKGTGRVKFGTLTATADSPVTGYIEILDASGTLRKLAVVA